jgi:CrcB protein
VKILLVALGGAVGSVLRYLVSGWTQSGAGSTMFPIGTLVVNVVGCFIIGVLAQLGDARGFLGPDARALLMVGLLGGFTTFSAFGNETMNSLRDGAVSLALLNVTANVGLGLLAVWSGRTVAHLIWS